MVGYADDFVILCRNQAEAEQTLGYIRQWCEAEGLRLHPTKTKIVNVQQEGFEFSGLSLPGRCGGDVYVLAQEEEHGEVQRDHPDEDETDERPIAAKYNRRYQPDVAWLVWILPAQLPHDV